MDKKTIDLLQDRMKRDVNVGIHGILDAEAIRYHKEIKEEVKAGVSQFAQNIQIIIYCF